jgi:polyisoprenoid-binding protein YceI
MILAVGMSLVCLMAATHSDGAAESYAADAAHSSLVYRVKHMNTSFFWGRFNTIDGAFALDESNPAESRFEFSVKADSIDTGIPKRDLHLKSPDFFNVVQYPTIAFKSSSVTKAGDGYDVAGELTLHGVTKPVKVKIVPTGKAKGPGGAPIAGIEATFTIKRSEFGMTNMVGPVGDDVWITVGIEGRRK